MKTIKTIIILIGLIGTIGCSNIKNNATYTTIDIPTSKLSLTTTSSLNRVQSNKKAQPLVLRGIDKLMKLSETTIKKETGKTLSNQLEPKNNDDFEALKTTLKKSLLTQLGIISIKNTSSIEIININGKVAIQLNTTITSNQNTVYNGNYRYYIVISGEKVKTFSFKDTSNNKKQLWIDEIISSITWHK
jgi:hypothetical protein